MPDKKDKGTIIKFVTVAILSNFSAHMPAIKPSEPNRNEDKNKYVIKYKWLKILMFTKKLKLTTETIEINNDLVTDAKIMPRGFWTPYQDYAKKSINIM